ncbi:MAG: hypothetical protein AAB869_00120 [Patescibacteria group bacterium]
MLLRFARIAIVSALTLFVSVVAVADDMIDRSKLNERETQEQFEKAFSQLQKAVSAMVLAPKITDYVTAHGKQP